jgi:hypothetical protein
MIIKDQHEKVQQVKEEIIRLRDELKKGPATYYQGSIFKLNNILDLLFENDNYTPSK